MNAKLCKEWMYPANVPLDESNVGPANDGLPPVATVLTPPLPLSSRDGSVLKTEDSRPRPTGTCPGPPVPSSSPASCNEWTRTPGVACPSEYPPVLQTLEDRALQGRLPRRISPGVDPIGTSVFPSNAPANTRDPVSTA